MKVTFLGDFSTKKVLLGRENKARNRVQRRKQISLFNKTSVIYKKSDTPFVIFLSSPCGGRPNRPPHMHLPLQLIALLSTLGLYFRSLAEAHAFLSILTIVAKVNQ